MRTVVARAVLVMSAFGALGAGVIGTAPPACACSCAVPDADDEYGRFQLIFTGTEIAREEPVPGLSSDTPITVTFRVERVYKGSATSVQSVITASQEASCGLARSARPQLLFARELSDGRFQVGLCDVLSAAEVPTRWGPGRAPVVSTPSAAPAPTPSDGASPAPVAGSDTAPDTDSVAAPASGSGAPAAAMLITLGAGIAAAGLSWRRRRAVR